MSSPVAWRGGGLVAAAVVALRLCAVCVPVRAQEPLECLYTLVGTGTAGFNGDGLPGPATEVNGPWEILLPPGDATPLFSDRYNHRVRRLLPNGTVTTVAGNGTGGFGGDGGPARNAAIGEPLGLTWWGGAVYVAQHHGGAIRKVNAAGVITTVAGTGVAGTPVNGALAAASQLTGPHGLSADGSGNLFVALWDLHQVGREGGGGGRRRSWWLAMPQASTQSHVAAHAPQPHAAARSP
jgi:hypothetical protein